MKRIYGFTAAGDWGVIMSNKIFRFRQRIQSTYITIAVLGVLFISVVVGASINNYIAFRDSLIEREQYQMLTLAESIAQSLTNVISNKEEDAKILSRLIVDQISSEGLKNYRINVIKPVLKNYLDVQQGAVFVVDWLQPDGVVEERFVNSHVITSIEGASVSQLHKPVMPSDFETTYTGKALQAPDGKMYLDILQPVHVDGEPFGVIRMVISLEHLYEEYVKQFRAGEKGYASLKDSDGILIMHPGSEDIGKDVMVARKSANPEYDWSELEALVKIQKQGRPGVGIYHSYWSNDEEKRRVKKFNGFYPAQVGEDFWIVNVSMDYIELVEIVNKHLYTSMVMVGAIPVLFVFMTIYVLNLKRNLDQLQIEHNYVNRLNTLNKELEEDIEQRKELEIALNQSRRRFRTLFNAGIDLTFVIERQDDKLLITDVNDIACKRLGISRESISEWDFSQLERSLTPERMDEYIDTMMHQGYKQYNAKLSALDTDEIPVEINCRQFEFQDKNYIMFIARDIAEREAQKEEIERHRALVIYKNRMAAVGEMVANIAHQWRQPLSSLNLMLSNLDDAYETNTLDEAYFRKQMDKSQDIIQKMSQIIDEFRYFFKPKEHRESFNLVESIQQVKDMLEDRIRIESINFSIDSVSTVEPVYGYPNQLAQVFLNLFSNALDAYDQNQDKRWIRVSVSEKNDLVRILVEDNAGGIESENISKLFEPYFTTKAESGGTGIGLYMSRMIIESKFMGSIDAQQGKHGLIFTIELPKDIRGEERWKSY